MKCKANEGQRSHQVSGRVVRFKFANTLLGISLGISSLTMLLHVETVAAQDELEGGAPSSAVMPFADQLLLWLDASRTDSLYLIMHAQSLWCWKAMGQRD